MTKGKAFILKEEGERKKKSRERRRKRLRARERRRKRETLGEKENWVEKESKISRNKVERKKGASLRYRLFREREKSERREGGRCKFFEEVS